jgi:hypothetical protein
VDIHEWMKGFDSNVTCKSHLSFKDSGIQRAFLVIYVWTKGDLLH